MRRSSDSKKHSRQRAFGRRTSKSTLTPGNCFFETLREVENDEGAHLGRALAGPVTTKFVELTGGRYKGLCLDATLKAAAVDVANAASGSDMLEALSVGTRDQLATLIRLTISKIIRPKQYVQPWAEFDVAALDRLERIDD